MSIFPTHEDELRSERIVTDFEKARADSAEARVKELEGREMRLDRMDYATEQHAKILVVNADLEAERDRLAARCAEKDSALQAALPYLWTHADMMPTVSAQDCTMQIAKEVEKALASDGSAAADVIAIAKELRTHVLPLRIAHYSFGGGAPVERFVNVVDALNRLDATKKGKEI